MTGAAAARIVGDAAAYGLHFVRIHAWRMVLWFFCLLLLLWGFAALVGIVHEKEMLAPVQRGISATMRDHFSEVMNDAADCL